MVLPDLNSAHEAPMSNVVVSVSARTDIGRQRAGNEDSFLVANLSAGEGPLDSGENAGLCWLCRMEWVVRLPER